MKKQITKPVLEVKSIFKGGQVLPETDLTKKHSILELGVQKKYENEKGNISIHKSEKLREKNLKKMQFKQKKSLNHLYNFLEKKLEGMLMVQGNN